MEIKKFIDTPVQNAECTGTIKVSGWILDPNGVKNIEVLVDDIVKGQATYGQTNISSPKTYISSLQTYISSSKFTITIQVL